MVITGNDFLRDKGEINQSKIKIHWNFIYINGNEALSSEFDGFYDIKTNYNNDLNLIKNAKTLINSYYKPFHSIIFSDSDLSENNITLSLNRIIKNEIIENILHLEFKMHSSQKKFAFNIKHPILSGTAIIVAEESFILDLNKLIESNYLINNEFIVPKCKTCLGLKSIPGNVDINAEIIPESFICPDCYDVSNNFFGILQSEVIKINDPKIMVEQRSTLLNFIEMGKNHSSSLGLEQLNMFFETIFVQVEYFSGFLKLENAITQLNKMLNISEEKSFALLAKYVQSFSDIIEKTKGLIPSQIENKTIAEECKEQKPNPIENKKTDKVSEILANRAIVEDKNTLSDLDKELQDVLEDKMNSSEMSYLESTLIVSTECQELSESVGSSVNIMAAAFDGLNMIECEPTVESISSSPLDYIKKKQGVLMMGMD